MDLAQFVDMAERDAMRVAMLHGACLRVLCRNGQQAPRIQQNFDPRRINFYIVDGIVTAAFYG